MKERIYSIPLTEVFQAGLGCPFCALTARAEETLIRVYLEGALMDPDWRGLILSEGLCRRHLDLLQSKTRKLGSAIIVQALLRQTLDVLTRGADGKGALPDWGSSCLACRDVNDTLVRHAHAFCQTWLEENDFRRRAAEAGAFCLPHLALLYREAGKFPRGARTDIRSELVRNAESTLKPLLEEVDWFVRKHDARFRDEPWRGVEDSVERAIRLIAGD